MLALGLAEVPDYRPQRAWLIVLPDTPDLSLNQAGLFIHGAGLYRSRSDWLP